jgi:hypothetical protein
MKVHANAVLGPAGRLALVQAIESGMTQKAAAAAFCVAPATAHRWWHRRLDASAEEVRSGSWLLDRSCVPIAAHGCSIAIPRSGSASGGNALAGDRAWWPARSTAITRPFGRSSPATASRARHGRLEKRPSAMSGPARRPAAYGYFALRAL